MNKYCLCTCDFQSYFEADADTVMMLEHAPWCDIRIRAYELVQLLRVSIPEPVFKVS